MIFRYLVFLGGFGLGCFLHEMVPQALAVPLSAGAPVQLGPSVVIAGRLWDGNRSCDPCAACRSSMSRWTTYGTCQGHRLPARMPWSTRARQSAAPLSSGGCRMV